jgi:serine/threonine-protein kinase
MPRRGYDILKKLATGGMATVFVGRRLGAVGFTRLVAIKRAHPHLASQATFRRMFVAEAMLASEIHHANVVSILDVVEQSDELSLILEYVEGCSAAQLTRYLKDQDQVLDPALALRIVVDATQGLAAAHELTDPRGRPAGVIHRDISPQNILIGTDGTAKLADFGIAKVLQSENVNTGTSVLRGKLGYMSPEYVARHQADPRGDIFAMGVVLWELLAGRRLFVAATEMETLKRVAACIAPAPSQFREGLPPALDRLVLKALSREPELRHQSARELLEELHAVSREAGLVAHFRALADLVLAGFGAEIAARRALLLPQGANEEPQRTATVSVARDDDSKRTNKQRDVEVEPTTDLVAKPAPPPSEDDAMTHAVLADWERGNPGMTEAAFTQSNQAAPRTIRTWRVAGLLAGAGVLLLGVLALAGAVVNSARNGGQEDLAQAAADASSAVRPLGSALRPVTAQKGAPEILASAPASAPSAPSSLASAPSSLASAPEVLPLAPAPVAKQASKPNRPTPPTPTAPAQQPTSKPRQPDVPIRCRGLDGLPLAACLENEARKRDTP